MDMPVKLQHLIKEMMDPFPDQRITHGDDDLRDIRKHTWFAGFDWKALDDGLMEAPWVPEVNGEEDTSNFHREVPPELHSKWSQDDEVMSNWEPDFW